MKKKISVVIPTYNEEGNVKPLAEAIVTVMETELPQYRYEILFIDNHSKDRTRMYLRELCAKNKNIKAIFNARNFGQLRSPVYGLKQATGDCVVRMCADISSLKNDTGFEPAYEFSSGIREMIRWMKERDK